MPRPARTHAHSHITPGGWRHEAIVTRSRTCSHVGTPGGICLRGTDRLPPEPLKGMSLNIVILAEHSPSTVAFAAADEFGSQTPRDITCILPFPLLLLMVRAVAANTCCCCCCAGSEVT